MSQYMISVIHAPEGPDFTPEQMQQVGADVDAFNEELRTSGSWVFGGGLEPPSSATVVDATGADVLLTDGPFAEAKEQLGGFWVLEVPDLETALDLAKRASAACQGIVELRPFADGPAEDRV